MKGSDEWRHMISGENTIRQFLRDIGHGDIVVEWDKVGRLPA